MKPVHVGLLVAAAALGGALFVKMTQSPAPAPQAAPAVAEQQQPAPAPTSAVEVPPAEPAKAVEPPPSPFPEKRKAEERKPEPRRAASPAPVKVPRPAPTVAQNQSPAMPAQQTASPAPPAAPASAPPAPVNDTPPAPAMRNDPVPPPPPPPEPHKVTLPVGTILNVRLVEGLSTERNHAGDTFTATLDQPLSIDGFVIAERGSRLEGKIVEAKEAGRVSGLAELGIALTRLRTSDGQNIAIQTDTFTKVAPKTVKEDVTRGAAATGIGAAIGAIAGGGKGAAIGAGIGAAAGVGGAVATRGKPAAVPTETRLTFRISEPVTITEKLH